MIMIRKRLVKCLDCPSMIDPGSGGAVRCKPCASARIEKKRREDQKQRRAEKRAKGEKRLA